MARREALGPACNSRPQTEFVIGSGIRWAIFLAWFLCWSQFPSLDIFFVRLKESCHEPTSLGDFFGRDFGDGDRAGILRNGIVSPERRALRIRDHQCASAVLAGGGSGLPRCRKMAGRQGGVQRAGEVFTGGGAGGISKSRE